LCFAQRQFAAQKTNALHGERRRLAARAVKGAGLWRSSERSEDPLQKKPADQAQCLVRKGGFSFMGRAGKEGTRSAQENFEQPMFS
jgi:hypothetical protein